jgi:hypothetical protein
VEYCRVLIQRITVPNSEHSLLPSGEKGNTRGRRASAHGGVLYLSTPIKKDGEGDVIARGPC